jgi:hypothetical protein
LGGYDYLKTRISLDKEGNLIIDSVHYGLGSAFFIIWSGMPVYKSSNIYIKKTNL